jgi:hypothetical protein
VPLGKEFTVSQSQKDPGNGGDESADFVLMCEAAWFVARGHAIEIVRVGCAGV